MKKLVKALSVILVLAVFTVMAMGSGSATDPGEIKTPQSVTTAPKEPEAKSVESTSVPEKTTPGVTVNEAVLVDQGGIRITVKGLDLDGWAGPSLKLLLENDTSRGVTVQCRNESVNGYMVETMMSTDLATGKKANDTLTFQKSYLERAGIDTIADMEFSFHIFDSETWDTIFDTDQIRVETSAAPGFEYKFDDSGFPAYNENGLEIVIKGLSANDSWAGPSVMVFIRNNSGTDLGVQVRDVSINGFMVDPMFSCDVINGKCAVDSITFMSSQLEQNDIKEIKDIELSFHVFRMDNWDTIVDTPVVTISF